MKYHDIKQLKQFDDIVESSIIKYHDCAFIREQNYIKEYDNVGSLLNPLDKEEFYICCCGTDDCFTICLECKDKCHKNQGLFIKIDIKKSSD